MMLKMYPYLTFRPTTHFSWAVRCGLERSLDKQNVPTFMLS